MCKSNTTQTNTQPPAWLQSAMQGFLGQAQGLIGSQTDPTKLVAPFNSEQQTAFGNIDSAQNMAPQAFSADAVNQYMSPYQNDVIQATEAQQRLQDNQQQNDLRGNIASAGAWGGDRSAVLQSELGGQQDTANNATIAGLYNQGYGQALGEFNTQQQTSLQEQQAKLAAATAQLGAGTLQQQNAQQIIDVPYQQLDFLGNLYGDLGGLFGGNSTTHQSQGFTFADGGVARRADGGGVTRNIFMPFGSDEASAAPGGGGRAHLGVQPAPAAPQQGGGLSGIVGDYSKLNSGLTQAGVNGGIPGAFGRGMDAVGLGDGTSGAIAAAPSQIPMAGAGDVIAGSGPLAAAGDAGTAAAAEGAAGIGAAGTGAAAAGSGGIADLLALLALKSGGRAPHRDMGGMISGGLLSGQNGMFGALPQKLDDGGEVSNEVVDDNGNLVPVGASALTQDQTPPAWQGIATNYAPAAAQPDQIPMAAAGDQGGISSAASSDPSGLNTPMWSDGTPVISKGASISDAGDTKALKPGFYDQNTYKPSPWMSVATGVLGALASRSLSKGALMGLDEYQREANPTVDHSGSTVHIRYANGPDFDSGVPTEAGLQMKAMSDYRTGMLGSRDAAIAERATAAQQQVQARQDALAQAAQAEKDRQSDRVNQLNIARINAGLEPLPDAGAASTPPVVDAGPSLENYITKAFPGARITSGQRTAAQNAAVNGVSHSAHLTDNARDFVPPPGVTLEQAAAHFNSLGVPGLKAIPEGPGAANSTGPHVHVQYVAPAGAQAPQAGQSQPSFIPPKFLSEPTLIGGNDAKGVPQQVMAQQDRRTGQWITADQNRTPVNLSNMRTLPNGNGNQGGRAEMYFNRITEAGNLAAQAAKNIMELPMASSTGIFGGRGQDHGLLNAAKESLTNSVTSQGVQSYNTMIAGVTRNLSAIEAAGLAPQGSLVHSMDSVILKEGDTNITKLHKMAEMRQIVEFGLEPSLSDPSVPSQKKQLVQSIISKMQQAIPFTQHDVTQLEYANNPQATIMDFAKQSHAGSAAAPPAQAVQFLKKNPNLAPAFEQKYGKGSAKQYLGTP